MFICSPGIWKVVAKFQSNPQQSFDAEFEVKEYGRRFYVLGNVCNYTTRGHLPHEDLCFLFCSSAKFWGETASWKSLFLCWQSRISCQHQSYVSKKITTTTTTPTTTTNNNNNLSFSYLFGEEVNGKAHVVFGFLKDGQKKSFPSSLQRVSVSIPVICRP